MEHTAASLTPKNRYRILRPISLDDAREKICSQVVKLAIEANSKGVYLDVVISPDISDYFYGDKDLLPEIVFSLVVASIENTSQGMICLNIESDCLPARKELPGNIRKLLDTRNLCIQQGGKLEIFNICKGVTARNKCDWGTRFKASFPFRSIKPLFPAFRQNYLE